jgi:hypothetical protein
MSEVFARVPAFAALRQAALREFVISVEGDAIDRVLFNARW